MRFERTMAAQIVGRFQRTPAGSVEGRVGKEILRADQVSAAELKTKSYYPGRPVKASRC